MVEIINMKAVMFSSDNELMHTIGEALLALGAELGLGLEFSGFTHGKSMLDEIDKYIYTLVLVDVDAQEELVEEVMKRLCKDYIQHDVVMAGENTARAAACLDYPPIHTVSKNELEAGLTIALKKAVVSCQRQSKRLLVRDGERKIYIRISDIASVGSKKNYMDIMTEDGCYRKRMTMKRMLSSLEICGFIRVHNRYLVNYKHIKEFTDDWVYMQSGGRVPVSRSRREGAWEKWGELS